MSRILLVVVTAVLLPGNSTAAPFAWQDESPQGLPKSVPSRKMGPFKPRDLDQAWASAQSRQLPLFLYVTSDNCLYCKKMRRQTLSHPQIGAMIMKYTEPAAVNASKSRQVAKKLNIRSFPTVLLISPQSEILCKIEGFRDPHAFAERLWPALRQAEEDRRVVFTADSGPRPSHPTAQ